jgi:glycosyltransferase involved in cell wall biosynthesis
MKSNRDREVKGMRDRILFSAYPLLPVSESSAGGAEQVLWNLQREMSAKGYRLTTAACAGSAVDGQLFATGAPARGSLPSAKWHEDGHATKCLELLRVREAIGTGFAMVHDHSGSFFMHAHKVPNVPMLATLHLPRSFYPKHAFHRVAPNVSFNCVSKAQAKTFADVPRMLGHVQNGIALNRFELQTEKQDYLLWLGRICEEKGTHIALDAAAKAGVPIVIAGSVYPFAYHQSYFEHSILPRLEKMGDSARFVNAPSFATKLDLLRNARAVLITSTAEETSSLVAMEAAACGTPVIAMKRGGLPEIVDHGVTGILVRNEARLVEAIKGIGDIRPQACRVHAETHFSAARMAADYEKLYSKLIRKNVLPIRPAEYQPIAA